MVTQKRRIETDEDRYGGYSSTTSNFSLFSKPSTTGTIDGQQEIDTSTSYAESLEESTTSYESPITTYEGESEYVASDMPSEENENEYTIVKTFMPNVERRTIVQEVEKPRHTISKTRVKLNARGKIFVSMYSVIACLLVAFSIYNAVAISNIKSTLIKKEELYEQTYSEVSTLQKNYDELSSMTNLDYSGYSPVGEGNTKVVQMEKRPTFLDVSKETNWFDKVCNFFSNLF